MLSVVVETSHDITEFGCIIGGLSSPWSGALGSFGLVLLCRGRGCRRRGHSPAFLGERSRSAISSDLTCSVGSDLAWERICSSESMTEYHGEE